MWYSSVIRPRKLFPKLNETNNTGSVEKLNSHQKGQEDVEDEETVTCGENMHQYLLNSTLHGLRYVGENQISKFER